MLGFLSFLSLANIVYKQSLDVFNGYGGRGDARVGVMWVGPYCDDIVGAYPRP